MTMTMTLILEQRSASTLHISDSGSSLPDDLDIPKMLADAGEFKSLQTQWATTAIGRVAVRGSGALASISSALAASKAESLDLEIIQLFAQLSMDEDCALLLGQHGAHKALLRFLSDDRLGVDDAQVYYACELAVDRCSAACSDAGLSFPLTSGDRADYILEKRPPFLCMAPTNYAIASSCQDDQPNGPRVCLRQVRQVSRAVVEDRINYDVGNRLWSASLVLSEWMLRQSPDDWLRGKKVLEMGAGLGLCGMLAADNYFGAATVVLSDFNKQVLGNLAYNVTLNGHDTAEATDGSEGDKRVRVVRMDWDNLDECDEEENSFDVIIGSDLVCQESDCIGVAAILSKYLKPDGHAIIALGSARSRYGVDAFESTLNSTQDLHVTSEPYQVPKLRLHDYTARASLEQQALDKQIAQAQEDTGEIINEATMAGDPWGRAIDDFDIGSAESYCMFSVVKVVEDV